MLRDSEGAGIGTFKSGDPVGAKSFTIDFNGFTYTCTGPAVGSVGTQSQAFHLEWNGNGASNVNVTLKNGTISAKAGVGVSMVIQNYCNLTLDGMTIDGSNLGTGGYALSNNCGNVLIKDSTIVAPAGGVAFDACDYASYTGVSVTVEGGSSIQGPIEVVNDNGGDDNARLTIEGGTFSSELVATDYKGSTTTLNGYLQEGVNLVSDGQGTFSVTLPDVSGAVATTSVGGQTAYFASLAEAVLAADENSAVTLLSNADVGIPIRIDKDLTLDLNGHLVQDKVAENRAFRVTEPVSFTVDGTDPGSGMTIPTDAKSYGFINIIAPATVTLNGGEYTGDTNQGAFFKASQGNPGDENTGASGCTLNLHDLTAETNTRFVTTDTLQTMSMSVKGGSYKATADASGGTYAAFSHDQYDGSSNFENVTIETNGGAGVELAGGYNNHFTNCHITVKEPSNPSFTATAVAASWGGDIFIDSGTYESAGYGIYVYSSGGVIVVNNGTVKGAAAAVKADVDSDNYEDATSTIQIANGVFDGELQTNQNEAAHIYVSGGTFTDDGVKLDVSVYFPKDAALIQDDSGNVIPSEDAVAQVVGGAAYKTLDQAITACPDGGTVKLLSNVVLDASGKGNNEGVLTITKDITLDGNGKTITAMNVEVTPNTTNGPSMINIQEGAQVVVRDLTIDGQEAEGADKTKHGLNVYGDTTSVKVENVTIKNGNGYGIVVNGASAIIDGLNTFENGWGGINVDSKSGKAELVIERANIAEDNSIKIENGSSNNENPNGNPKVEINDGSFKHVFTGMEIGRPDLIIKGGTFATGAFDGAINPGDFVADGLEWNPVTGKVEEEQHYVPPVVIPSTPTYDVSVPKTEGGEVSLSDDTPKAGDKVVITATPDEGKEVASVSVAGVDGKPVDVTDNGDGTWTFTMPKGDVTVTVTFACDGGELCPSHRFPDVDPDEWYHSAVDWVVSNGLMTGFEGGDMAGLFGPNVPLTRAQLAEVLWRQAGEPEAEGAPGFSDVSTGDWFADAVAWAASEGVMTGYEDGSGRFGPDDVLTREQLAVVYHRLSGSPEEDADLTAFPDAGEVSDWAEPGVEWAVSEGLLRGYADTGELDPAGELSRAQMATVLMRLAEE